LGVVAIEWASKLTNLPSEYLKINLTVSEKYLNSAKVQTSFAEIQNQQAASNLADFEFDSDLAQDLLEDLPKARLIELIANGETYIKLLEQFKVSE
jgi:hypothetical protein